MLGKAEDDGKNRPHPRRIAFAKITRIHARQPVSYTHLDVYKRQVQQIEVLRGPQGTTYGRGATGGVINIVTARPTSQFGGYARATYGNYDARTLEGALGGPIAGENLMFRVAGKYEKRDGYGTNLFTGNPVDDRDAYAIRGSLLAKFSSNLDLLIVADHFKAVSYTHLDVYKRQVEGDAGSRRYLCNDGEFDDDFDDLIFTLEIGQPGNFT